MLSKTEDQAEVDNDDEDADDYVDGYKNECCYRASWRWLEKNIYNCKPNEEKNTYIQTYNIHN